MIANGGIVGLAEGITDDTCLVFYIVTHLHYCDIFLQGWKITFGGFGRQ